MNYLLLPKVEYRLRAFITVILFITGLLIQWSSKNFFAGLIFILPAGLFHIVKGVKLKRPKGGKLVWRSGDNKELSKVESHLKRIKKWKGLGIGARMTIAIIVLFLLIFVTPFLKNNAIFIWDLVILFAPIFLTGSKSVWEPADLRPKVKSIKNLIGHFPWQKYLTYSYNIEFGIMRKVDGSYPFDVRMKIKRKDQNANLLGVQGQYSINRVGSKSYPYFYIVIVAKQGFGIRKKIGRVAKYTLEFEKDDNVEVAIIRQHTTKTSGYHTPLSTQISILKTSLDVFEQLNAK